MVKNLVNRVIRLGDWLSAGVNSLILDGCVDESISGRTYRMAIFEQNPKWAKVKIVVDGIWYCIFRQENHCMDAYVKDLVRAENYKNRHDVYTGIKPW